MHCETRQGLILTPLLMFIVGPVVALLFRFPIPMVGYLSGPEAVIPSVMAVAVYGVLLGLFIPLAALGFAGAVMARRLSNGRELVAANLVLISSLLIDLAAAMLLATWDKIYGPW